MYASHQLDMDQLQRRDSAFSASGSQVWWNSDSRICRTAIWDSRWRHFYLSLAHIPLGLSRHVRTRNLAPAFWHRKKSWRDETCHACRTAWRDMLITTSTTCTAHVQGHRHSVGWGGHVHVTFSRSCSWDWCKSRTQKTKLVHASTTAS